MADAGTYDEEEVKLLLSGDAAEQNEGFKRLYFRFKRPLWVWLRRGYPLSIEDVEDVFSQTMHDVWRAFTDDPERLNRPLDSFVFTVAKRRAIDLLRKRGRQVKTVEQDVSEMADALSGSPEINAYWKGARKRDEIEERRYYLRGLLRTLPPRQRAVAEIIAEDFPDDDDSVTVRKHHERTGERLTVTAVRSARRQVYEKLSAELTKRGGIR